MNDISKRIVNIVVLDIETTGLRGKGYIVEIGMVLVNLKNGLMKKIFDEIISHPEIRNDPKKYKNSWIFQNSTLTLDNVLKSWDIKVFRKRIQSILNKYFVTAFNKEFDIGYLHDYDFGVANESPCIMKKLTPVMKMYHPYHGFKFPKVEEAWNFYFPEIKYKELHRAFDDAFHEAQILFKMIEHGILFQ